MKTGKCTRCGNAPRKLTDIDGAYVCITCKRELRPGRPKGLATVGQIERARKLWFKVADDAQRDYVRKILDMHNSVAYYVYDVWEALTGQRAIRQGVPREELDKFVTGLFRDSKRVHRIDALQKNITETARSRMTPEEFNDPYQYESLAKYKPPLIQDSDFAFVAGALRTHFPNWIS